MRDGASGPITDELKVGMRWLVHHFRTAGPRVVSKARDEPPVLIFSDGACEVEGTTVGAIMFDPLAQAECFGAKLSERTISEWRTRLGQDQVIGQAELFPLLVSRLTWASRLRNRRVLYFIDNEAARIGMVKAYSPVLPSLNLIMSCLGWDYSNNSQAWFARVCSYSNIADGPSRLIKPAQEIATCVSPVFPEGHYPDVVL